MAELTQAQQAFIDRFAPYANLASQQTGLPSRVILGKLAIESNWGQNMYRNNIAGLKPGAAAQNEGSLGYGKAGTFEDYSGGRTQIKDNFLQYASPEQGIGGFVSWLTNSGIPSLNSLADRKGGGVFSPDANADQAAINALNASPFSTDVNLTRTLPSRVGSIPDLAKYGVASSFDPTLNRLAQLAPYEAGGTDVSLGAGDITSNNYWSGRRYQAQGEVLPREKGANGLQLPSPEMASSPAQLSALDKISDGLTGGLRAGANLIGNRFVEATGRLPTAEEFGARVDALKSGARDVLSQLTEIASSPEARSFGQATGLDPSQYVVNDIYRLGLGRGVDAPSAAAQMEVLRTQGAGSLLNQVTNSQEGRTYALNNFYENNFGRGIDAGGLDQYLADLSSGKSLRDVETGILSSPEALSLGFTPDQIPSLVGDFSLPYLQGVNTPGFQPGPLNGGNFNLPSAPGVNTGNSFPTSPLQGGNYNLDPLNPVNPGTQFQTPGLQGGNYNIDPLSPVNPGNPFQTPGLNGGNYNLPNVPMPGTPVQPVGPGAVTNPVGPGSETSPVAPGGLTNAVGPGAAQSPIAPGAEQGPVAPGGMTSPVTPSETSAFVPAETQAVAPPAAVPAFNAQAYLAANPDVQASGVDPLTHFLRYGYGEGRAIDASGDRLPQGFDANAYLAANQDVALSGMNPLEHFARYGVAEGRALSPTGFSNANVSGSVGNGTFASTFNPSQYLAVNPDVAASGMDPLAHFVKYGLSEGRAVDTAGDRLPMNFDGNAYLAQNQDVARSGMSPLEHYLRYGAAEGRAAPTGSNPYSFSAANVSQGLGPTGNGTFAGTFNPGEYLAANRDVAASGMSALDHYLQYGFNEGRAIDTRGDRINQGFDPLQYLNLNQDVKAAGMDPLRHFLTAGASEGRALPTGSNHYSFTNFNVANGLGNPGVGSFGLGGITSSAPGGMGTMAPAQTPAPAAPAPSANLSNPFGFSGLNAGVYTPPNDGRGQSGGFVDWESASANALPGSGGRSGSAWFYTDKNGQQQIATFDPQKSENAYLAGQVAQNQAQIEAGRASEANNPNLWNYNATNLLNSVAASNYQPAPIYSTATAQTAALAPTMPAPFNSPLPVMQQGLRVNPYGGFGLISAF